LVGYLGGAGKSTVAKHIKENIPITTIIEMDDFYASELTRNDLDRVFEQAIKPLKIGSPASYQRFD
jgi:uridine kinase